MTPPSTRDNDAHSQFGRKDQVYEKRDQVELDDLQSPSLHLYCPEVDTLAVDPRKLKRKIDFRFLPLLTLLYLMNFLDRGSIGNARLYNMQKDLHMTDKQYLLALTVFFFPYALFEVPSNLVLRYLRPSRWLPFIVFAWGIVMTFHGFAHNYGDLISLRCLLGLAEAGLYPGIIFYLSCWYKRSELGSRVALFFTAATMAGAFSGFLAVAIHNMDGLGGRPGWAWIFILEGLATILIACVSPWVLQDFPETAKFLTEVERVYIIRELREDQRLGTDGEKFKLKYLWQCLTDWKTFLTMGIHMGFTAASFSISLFMPTIIRELGFSPTTANLLSVPVYALACLLTCVVGFLGDRFGHRGYINLGFLGMAFVAYVILIVSRNVALSYFAVYLAACSLYPAIPNNAAWTSSNLEGSYKRAAALAMAISFGNMNAAVTSNVYRAHDRPWYRLGHGVVLAYVAVAWLSSLIYTVLLRRENKARDRGERDEVIEGVENKNANPINGRYSSVADARREKGDRWSGFRYTV
ncbi:MFS general substrate transporter [Russula earlei]|uniref:MFS general substrate transporter n=1 Tax=Russula earlei TaxID=71964 RepID=A0ACC0U0B7_9AGAM|nr:MFS general substrate transporter [Russula earlei]